MHRSAPIVIELFGSGLVQFGDGNHPAQAIARDIDQAIILHRKSHSIQLGPVAQYQNKCADIVQRLSRTFGSRGSRSHRLSFLYRGSACRLLLQDDDWRLLLEHDDGLTRKKRETNWRRWCLSQEAFSQSQALLSDWINQGFDCEVRVDGVQMLEIEAKAWGWIQELIKIDGRAVEKNDI